MCHMHVKLRHVRSLSNSPYTGNVMSSKVILLPLLVLQMYFVSCRELAIHPENPTTLPIVKTMSGTPVVPRMAILRGIVNPGGKNTTYYFEYGLTSSYGNATIPRSIAPGQQDIQVGDSIFTLVSGATYHFCLKAENSNGLAKGSDSVFVTPVEFAFPVAIGTSWTYHAVVWTRPREFNDPQEWNGTRKIKVTSFKANDTDTVWTIQNEFIFTYRAWHDDVLMDSSTGYETTSSTIEITPLSVTLNFIYSSCNTVQRFGSNSPVVQAYDKDPYSVQSIFATDTGLTKYEFNDFHHPYYDYMTLTSFDH